MTNCDKCQEIIDKDNEFTAFLKCIFCKKKFHTNCAGHTKTFLKSLAPYKNFCWTCDECTIVRDIKCDFNEELYKLKSMCDKIFQIQNSQSKDISELKSSVSKNVNSEKMSYSVQSDQKKRLWSNIVESDNTPILTNSVKRNRLLNSQSGARDSSKPRTPVVIVRAKNDKHKSKMRSVIVQVLDPKLDPVSRVDSTANGDVIIKCKSADKVDEVIRKINIQTNQAYEVSKPKSSRPIIKIVGFYDNYCSESKIVEALKAENDQLFDNSSKIEIVSGSVKKSKNNVNVALVALDYATHQRCLARKRVIIGFISCPVYEHVNIVRCFKCCEFGHIADKCVEKEITCPLCSENHDIKQCTSRSHKCINCLRSIKKYNLENVNVNHTALSIQCPIMKKKFENRLRSVKYNE